MKLRLLFVFLLALFVVHVQAQNSALNYAFFLPQINPGVNALKGGNNQPPRRAVAALQYPLNVTVGAFHHFKRLTCSTGGFVEHFSNINATKWTANLALEQGFTRAERPLYLGVNYSYTHSPSFEAIHSFNIGAFLAFRRWRAGASFLFNPTMYSIEPEKIVVSRRMQSIQASHFIPISRRLSALFTYIGSLQQYENQTFTSAHQIAAGIYSMKMIYQLMWRYDSPTSNGIVIRVGYNVRFPVSFSFYIPLRPSSNYIYELSSQFNQP